MQGEEMVQLGRTVFGPQHNFQKNNAPNECVIQSELATTSALCQKWDFMPITRAMDEQMKALLEGIKALKSGQEETKERMENMQRSQEETRKGQQEMQKEKINSVEKKIALKVEEKITVVEEKIEKKVEQVEERIEGVVENFSLISQQMEDLEKKLLAGGNENKSKSVCMCLLEPVLASPVPVPASPISLKLSIYDGKTNWEEYKTQFCIISEANGWNEGAKAYQLAAFLRGEAAEILQTLPDIERLNLNSLYNALDLRLGQKYSKEYTRLQMKTRLQKTVESLQEYASEVERLANLAFSDHPETVRETISLQYFVDGLKEGKIQKVLRMADVQDLKFTLLYALKLEAATQASRKDRHFIRGARVTEDEPCESRLLKEMEILKEEMQTIKAGISKHEKRNFRFWGCGGTGHLRRNCPRSRKDENTVSSSKQITAVNGGNEGLYVIGQIKNISCRMVVDTGANVSIIRKDLAQNSQVSIIWTPPCVSSQTVTGDKIHVHGKANITLRFGNIDYHHTAYIADITDPCILELDFLKNNNFKLDFENSNMHSKFEDITLFGLQTQFESNQKIITKTKLSLSPRTECIIPGLVAENRKFRFGLIDYPDPDSLKAGVLIASSVVDLSNSVILVRIANISDRTRTIQEGEVIAACAAVTCVDRKCNTQDLSSEDLVKDLLQNTDLDEKQRCAARGLIKEFQSLFSRTSEDFGRTRLTKHRIDTGEHPSIRQNPR
ncbi:retrovirus-related Pol polyprotein from transposon 412 [Trichonephila clavipes]|nr:retrovirus-related Pol polyprotein from transposon 412 [Trichonephila clavipes]